jgi:hypothetical protein
VITERDRIKTVMTPAEIAEALKSGDYSAEMLMQHLIRHHNRLERELGAERAIADRMGNAIKRIEAWIGDSSPLGQSLAAWKESRSE